MKFRCERDVLVDALATAGRAVGGRGTQPGLSGVRAALTGDRLELTGSDIDLTINFGETLCVVGPNGCGKTTLINLLFRFHDPAGGAVRLDDVDLRQFRLRDLRRLVGMVTQQTVLFDDTVYHNIRYGSPQASTTSGRHNT